TNTSGTSASIAAGAIGETVPANTTHAGGDDFSCASSAVGSSCSNTNAITVPGNGSVTLLFRVTVDSPLPAGTTAIVNAATVPADIDCTDCGESTPVEEPAV